MKDANTKESQQSPHFHDSFYRVVIKGLYVRGGKVLLGHDSVIRGREPVWELPGGGLNFGESFKDALKREVKEETGLEVTWVAEKPTYLWTVRWENARGMEWWYSLVMAFQFDVNSFDDFISSDSCGEMKFFSKEELNQLPNLHPQAKRLATLFKPADFA